MTKWILLALLAYLVGSIPFGVIIARLRGVDIRAHGSGNIGATNVGRVLGRRWGMLCFALDFAKGFAPVLAAGRLAGPLRDGGAADAETLALWLLVAVAAVVGHMASLFLGLKGGKGVATSFGALVGVWPVLTLPALGALLVWLAVVRAWRMVSLASVCAAATLPVLATVASLVRAELQRGPGLAGEWPACLLAAALGALVVWRHRANLDRIRQGVEPRIGSHAK